MMDGQRAALDGPNEVIGNLAVAGDVWHREVPEFSSDADRLR
ncbi:hypothetical protein D083_2387 [Dickeya solani RNS 08.23.3.1.A]|nr:hypothetical protein D083_2387 [Dickeya solani RNS 08.23.3.1.A]